MPACGILELDGLFPLYVLEVDSQALGEDAYVGIQLPGTEGIACLARERYFPGQEYSSLAAKPARKEEVTRVS